MKVEPSLKEQIDRLVAIEHGNTQRLATSPLYYPVLTKDNLYDSGTSRYDASDHVCVAFRRKEDRWKDLWAPFGNMNGGFEFSISGVRFPTSEHAYMCGIFSTRFPLHRRLQERILEVESAYIAKKTIRVKHRIEARLDWHSMMLEWMLYCVWEKTRQNEEFRRLLMAVPENAVIIEDSSFKQKSDRYWGCVNPERKAFAALARRYVRTLGLGTKKAYHDVVNALLWDYCNVGVFEGRNQMGKILTYIKDCLHKGSEPDIDYALLDRKRIYLLGNRVEFK